MDMIKNYIDNVFTNLPQTNEVLRAKEDMLVNMEDKYQAYVNEGHSENEALGKVISGFGNIDELIAEMKLNLPGQTSVQEPSYKVSKMEAEDWLKSKRKYGLLTSIGVFLCLAGVAVFILMDVVSANIALSIAVLLSIIAVATGLFIYSGMQLEKFTFFDKKFELNETLKRSIEDQKNEFHRTYTMSIVAGVIICILAPLLIIMPGTLYHSGGEVSQYLVGMILLIGVAAFLFTYFGNIKDGYNRLLQIGDHQTKYEDKILRAFSSAIWPLATLIFLLFGFLGHYWGTAWIVFPITAFVSIIFRVIYSAIKKD